MSAPLADIDAVTSTTPSSTSSQVSITSDSSSSAEASATSSIASSVSSEVLSDTTSTTDAPQSSPSTIFITNTASAAQPTTELVTSVVTQSPTAAGQSSDPVTVVVTATRSGAAAAATSSDASKTTDAATSATSSSAATLANNGSSNKGGGGGGLSTGGKTAIAVVIPVAAVAILLVIGLFWWRKRKQQKQNKEQLRNDISDYNYNPNDDPTLPAVSESGGEMTEDHSSGYRGWGAATASNRKASTTLSGGHTQGQLSDGGSNPYGQHSPGETQSGDPLVNQRNTMSSDELGALGAAPAAGTAAAAGAMRRGPSNASSRYSNGARSEGSDEPVPQLPPVGSYDYNSNNNYSSYGQPGPYGDGSYGGGAQENGMPIVRDVSARRNTRIQQGGTYSNGNSGIAQNF